jgi:CubicO group peptidase (beta-lactamase class C family)
MNYAIQDRNTRVNDFISRDLESNEFPGIQYIVLNADSTLFSYHGGSADIAGNRPVQVNTTMMIYSMSKTITAAAVLQLAEQGTVSLNDPITKYLNNIPYGKEVTIRHLLSQTSGIPNPIPLRWVHLVEEHPQFDEHAALQEILKENADLDFMPGKKYVYSNISYWLLGYLIEKASGTSYEDYVRQNIFQRLNIAANEIDFVIPSRQNHSKGYLPKWSFLNLFKSFVIDSKFVGEYEDGWLHIKDHYLNGPAFGGIVGSARAVGVFLQDQLKDSSRLFTVQTRNLFFQQQKNNDGEPINMTLGWHIGTMDNVRYFFKEGGGGGFHSEMRIYPALGIATVVIANNTSFDAKGFLNTVDKEFRRSDIKATHSTEK